MPLVSSSITRFKYVKSVVFAMGSVCRCIVSRVAVDRFLLHSLEPKHPNLDS